MTPLYIILTLIALTQVFTNYYIVKIGSNLDNFKQYYWRDRIYSHKIEAAEAKDAIIIILQRHQGYSAMPIQELQYELMKCGQYISIPRIKQYIEEINKDIPGIELTYNN